MVLLALRLRAHVAQTDVVRRRLGVGRRGADARYTFGYRRAELIGALVNLTTLILVALYLMGEAVMRLVDPQPVQGGWVMIASLVALVVDLGTVLLLWTMSEGNMNVRAAFIHNLTDAAASVVVLIGGAIIWWVGWSWVDPVLTLLLALWILSMSVGMFKRTAAILMDNTPPELDLDAVVTEMRATPGVLGVHHLHVWELDEKEVALEAHVVMDEPLDVLAMIAIKAQLKELLRDRFQVGHSTLEFEFEREDCLPGCADIIPTAAEPHDHDHHSHDHDHDHHGGGHDHHNHGHDHA